MSPKFALAVVLGLVLCVSAIRADAVFPGCNGQLNDLPTIEQTPQLLKKIPNAEKYIIKEGLNYVYIVKVQGSAYEMGVQLGEIFGEELKQNCEGLLAYVQNQLVDEIRKRGYSELVASIVSYFAEPLLNFALDLNYLVSIPYTPARYEEEMHGIEVGSKGLVSYELIRRVNLIPELTQAACTEVGAWNTATKDGHLLQLRALDWNSDTPLNQFPAILIYNSTEPGSNVFASIGYAGFVGAITALSKNGIGISEKVWIPPRESVPYPRITYFGKPWTYVLRDLAQFGQNLEQMLGTLAETKRTMRIHIGLSSLPDNSYRGIDYSSNVFENFNDQNYTYTPQHPQMDGVQYFDKHTQPSDDPCVGNILKASLGNITPATLYREVAGFHQTGNTQMCAFDITTNELWLSYSEFGTNVDAYKRPAIHVKMNDFWGN